MNRAIVYTVGHTHTIYINLSDEEAEKRWQQARDARAELEIMYEEESGHTVERQVTEFQDSFQIWGNAAQELQDITQALIGSLGAQFGR
jgi:hypothetical protein